MATSAPFTRRWSGNHLHYAERTFTGETVLGGGELLLPGEVRLGTGESYTSPWVYFSAGVGLDAVARRFHRHLRARPRPVSAHRPVTLNVWEAVYFDHRLERLVDLAERAARVGVERYVLDDGWFGGRRHDDAGLGDWVVSDEAWPDGLHPLVDRVTALGMQFGLWFEPEMVNPDSDVARAHPEWMMAARDELPVPARHQQVLDLTVARRVRPRQGPDPGAARRVRHLATSSGTTTGTSSRRAASRMPGDRRYTARRWRCTGSSTRSAPHIPTLEIESCSSGGARVDLGILERTDRVWVSDVIDPLERQHMLRWTTQLVPPEYMGSHIASDHSHSTGRRHDLSFRAGTAVFGHLGIEWDLTAVDEATLDEIGEWLTFYKEQRHLLLGGDLVRVDAGDPNVLAHGVLAPDRSEAVFAIATVGNPAHAPGPRVRFPGLDATTRYRVRPVLVGEPPSGLIAPAWWGEDQAVRANGGTRPHSMDHVRTVLRGASYPGAVLSGAALAQVGTTPPVMNPDQVVLFHCRAEEGHA